MIVKQEATRDLTLSHFIRHGKVMDVADVDEKNIQNILKHIPIALGMSRLIELLKLS